MGEVKTQIPTTIKQGTIITELTTGKEMVVTQSYKATEAPLGLHFQVMAKYTVHKDYEEGRVCRQFLFSDIGKLWAYK